GAAGGGGTDDRERPDEQEAHAKIGWGAAQEPDLDQPPADRERAQVLGEIRAGDVIEDHVDAAALGERADALREVLLAVVDRRGRAEGDALPALLLAAGRDVAGMAGLAQQRDGRGPDAAAAPVDQRALARLE